MEFRWWKIAKKTKHTGVMVALSIPYKIEKDIISKVSKANPALKKYLVDSSELHITMFYMGDMQDLPRKNKDIIKNIIRQFVSQYQPVPIHIGGVGVFHNQEKDGTYALHLIVDSHELRDLREKLASIFDNLGIEYSKKFTYTPHMTIGYIPDSGIEKINLGIDDFSSSNILLAWGDEHSNFVFQKRQA